MRRAAALLALLGALALVSAAAASLAPVRHDFGDVTLPRVRAAQMVNPPRRAEGRVQVLLRLRSAPLAAWSGRRLASAGGRPRLDLRAPGARRYVARLAHEQAAAERSLRLAVPEARVGRRYHLLLNAIVVDVPARSLARLRALPWVTRIYPSLRYTLFLNTSPALIGATALTGATGADGEGVKIAIVDDGIDAGNPFLDPGGFSYPDGFPKGDAAYTTPKVIVARSFPAFGAPPAASLPFDPAESFHATHVAGIAAGVAGTAAPAGRDHPAIAGLSGVAPRAWIGNYRVFSYPTPVGDNANTPEIVAAFEAAVADGMDVINFSGGGPETEPANDAMIETVRNVALAGVVPVISAGNERDELGFGTIGTPGTAPDAITVAAVSNSHVFAPALSLEAPDAPPELEAVPYQPTAGPSVPAEWADAPQTLVDIGSVQGTDGRPVDRRLCAPGDDPNARTSALPLGALAGAVAVVWRGPCGIVGKLERARAAGAAGVVLVDNRAGEASGLPVEASLPSLVIADLDGARLGDYLAAHGGRAAALVGHDPLEIATGRSGVVTSFSSGGPEALRHELKPDLAAPGGQVLSSTTSGISGVPFAVFDGTSMSAPHVSGAAALLLQRHPDWEPWQVKSALVSTAGTAWADTARTTEAPVTLAGGGLVDVSRADVPLLFTRPASLSFGDLDVTRGPASGVRAVTIADAGGGAGTWSVEVRPQSSSAGASLSVPASVTVPAGGAVELAVGARAGAGAAPGDDFGFIVLRRGSAERRIPYLFYVTRPALAAAKVKELFFFQTGSTATGRSLASSYRFPTSPFALFVDPGAKLAEDGAEQVYSFLLDRPVINFGVAAEPLSPSAQIDPFVLGSPDENTVQGFAGTPTNVNPNSFTFLLPAGAAGVSFPLAKRYYVAVDSGRDFSTGKPVGGRYVLHAWVDDLTPPYVALETTRIGSRRGLIAMRAVDDGAGIDPLSLTIAYGDVAISAAFYDPSTGLALFPLPPEAPALRSGRNRLLLLASDFQEAKNVVALTTDPYPNTGFREEAVTVATGRPVVSWLEPGTDFCVFRSTELLVSAESPKRIRLVRFYDGGRLVGTDRRAELGSLFRASVELGGGGEHRLRAVAVDAAGREAVATRTVSLCG